MTRLSGVALFVGLSLGLACPMLYGGQDEKLNKVIGQFLQDKDVKKRRLALLELEISGPKVKGVLQAMSIALEKDSEPEVRREVALALGRMGPDAQGAIAALAYALKNDKDEAVRELAAKALLQMVPNSQRALQQLVDALQDSYAPTRAAAAETIKTLGEQSKSAVPKLVEYLKLPKDKKADATARMNVALALGRVGEEGAQGTAVLIAVLLDLDEDVTVRAAAAESLGRLGADAEGAGKPLADVLGNAKTEQTLRLATAKALAKVEGDGKQIWPGLKVGLADNDATMRIQTIRATGIHGKQEPEAIKTLAKLARNDDNVEVRLAAVQELGLMGGAAKEAVQDLRYVMDHDEREAVREQAAFALKRIQESEKR
jgi:HEAT repeat protein